jgi:hypothetical protein
VNGEDAPVMRVTTFRPRDPWQELDHHLRDEVLPRFASAAGLRRGWVGRRGAEGTDQRVIVSIWSSSAAAAAAPTVPDILGTLVEAAVPITDEHTDVLSVGILEEFTRDMEMHILRVFRGIVVTGELDRYIERARQGTLEDGARANGPGAVAMGMSPPDGFVTVSTWPDWAAIEAATGGNIAHPLLTRSRELIREGGPTHYELLTTVTGREA